MAGEVMGTAPTPPINRLGGPPPGSSPAGLSAIAGGADPQGGGPTPSGTGGGLAKVFFNVEEQLDTIASALPEAAEEIDQIKAQLKGVLVKAVPQGGSSSGPSKVGLDSPGEPMSF
jgi:hypothetical protein